MLEPILCGPFSRAPLLPKLRGHFAEFLNNASPAGLRILSSSTCVGLRYGYSINYSGFSRHKAYVLPYYNFGPHHGFGLHGGFACRTPPPLVPVFPLPAHTYFMRPHSSVILQCRNLNLLSIGYVSPPLLRSRLTQGRSALPWKPWIFGLKDSHLHLATHSGILSTRHSTTPSGMASSCRLCSSTNPDVAICYEFLLQLTICNSKSYSQKSSFGLMCASHTFCSYVWSYCFAVPFCMSSPAFKHV